MQPAWWPGDEKNKAKKRPRSAAAEVKPTTETKSITLQISSGGMRRGGAGTRDMRLCFARLCRSNVLTLPRIVSDTRPDRVQGNAVAAEKGTIVHPAWQITISTLLQTLKVTKADVCVCSDVFERDLPAEACRLEILADGACSRRVEKGQTSAPRNGSCLPDPSLRNGIVLCSSPDERHCTGGTWRVNSARMIHLV